uniref:Uncharacterized protein n=1 Tax=Salvator merianae TaxID=96440 RepID=A0A8D0DRG9_SALMN
GSTPAVAHCSYLFCNSRIPGNPEKIMPSHVESNIVVVTQLAAFRAAKHKAGNVIRFMVKVLNSFTSPSKWFSPLPNSSSKSAFLNWGPYYPLWAPRIFLPSPSHFHCCAHLVGQGGHRKETRSEGKRLRNTALSNPP